MATKSSRTPKSVQVPKGTLTKSAPKPSETQVLVKVGQRSDDPVVPVPAAQAAAMSRMATDLAAKPAADPVKPPTVALRGGLAIQKVKLTGKNYRVSAQHNMDWWKQCTDAVAAGKGEANVADLIKAGVPGIFVGYVVRRGYLQPA